MFDRLGSILKSYIDDEYAHTRGRNNATKPSDDTDDFANLNTSHEGNQFDSKKNTHTTRATHRLCVPRELSDDFTQLGLSPEASFDVCKKKYKQLMHTYHPDRHEGNSCALIQAHEMSARINISFQRISTWFTTGKLI